MKSVDKSEVTNPSFSSSGSRKSVTKSSSVSASEGEEQTSFRMRFSLKCRELKQLSWRQIEEVKKKNEPAVAPAEDLHGIII